MLKFNVTYETITEESAEHGDTADAGFLAENVSLREAIDDLGCGGEGMEANEYPVSDPRWVTAYRTDEDYRTGEVENRSLHFPDNMTASSKLRVCRLLGVYGVEG
jgi:hypothetical protein